MIVQPLNGDLEKTGDPIIAVDTVGSGPGEVVYYITASEAVIPLPVDMAPVDASIVGIVDSVNSEKLKKSKT
jgi:ethanolamine utilization protein EutN